jgi:hypothetical protein
LEFVSTSTRPTDGADYRCACNNKCHPAGPWTGVAGPTCGHGGRHLHYSGRKPAQRGRCRERLGQEAFSWTFSRFEPTSHSNPCVGGPRQARQVQSIAGAARIDLRKIDRTSRQGSAPAPWPVAAPLVSRQRRGGIQSPKTHADRPYSAARGGVPPCGTVSGGSDDAHNAQ